MFLAPALRQTAEGGNGFLCDGPFLEGPQILRAPAQKKGKNDAILSFTSHNHHNNIM